jgi:hypothetical protein
MPVTRRRRSLLLLALALLPAAAGCRSNTAHLRSMQRTAMQDLEGRGIAAGIDPYYLNRQTARIHEVREMVDEEQLETAEDHFLASLILVSSTERDDLLLAKGLGEKAGELGDRRGLRVAAEAEDKLLLMEGRPQRWGTQVVYQPILGSFRLEAVDSRTTDEEREATGVPPRAELERRVEMLNELKDEQTQR